jgi:hypothetical protein
MIEIIRRRRNVLAGEQNVCFGQFIVYIIPSGFPSVSVSDNFSLNHTFILFSLNLTYGITDQQKKGNWKDNNGRQNGKVGTTR